MGTALALGMLPGRPVPALPHPSDLLVLLAQMPQGAAQRATPPAPPSGGCVTLGSEQQVAEIVSHLPCAHLWP